MTRMAAFVGLLVLAFVSACGSSGASGGQSAMPTPAPTATAPPTATAAPNGTAAIIHYQLDASGTTALSQQFLMAAGVAGSPETCAQFVGADQFVSGGHRFYQLLGGSVGSAWTLNLDIQPHNGPGTYTTTTSQLEFDLAGGTYPPFGATGQQGLKLTTRADGSGTFTISAWADVNNQAKTESGTLSWTCKNG